MMHLQVNPTISEVAQAVIGCFIETGNKCYPSIQVLWFLVFAGMPVKPPSSLGAAICLDISKKDVVSGCTPGQHCSLC